MKAILGTFFAALFAVFALVSPVAAYTIDGDLSDWGVTPFTDWVPNNGTIDYTEDNAPLGADIGSGSIPSGGELFDLEAIYFDDDGAIGVAGNAYFAVVTSMPEGGSASVGWSSNYTMGDLALDIDNDGVNEYGIKILGPGKGMICHNPKWKNATMPGPGTGYPYEFTCDNPDSNVTGYANVVYASSAVTESVIPPTYIIEISAPKSALGSPSQYQMSHTDVTLSCGNDLIRIDYDWDFPAPAFPAAAVPLGIVLFAPVGAYFFARRQG